MNLQYFEPPLKVQNNDAVSCPYIKTKNKYINTPIPQAQTFSGKPVEHTCTPNLSDRLLIPGFRNMNFCHNNKPIHLNFHEKEISECYSAPDCSETSKINTCLDPYMQQ